MKKLFRRDLGRLFVLFLLFSVMSPVVAPVVAQTLMPARQVSVTTNAWDIIDPSTSTAQSAFDYLDGWADGMGEFVSNSITVIESQLDAKLPGTNLVGGLFDTNTQQWIIFPGTNLIGGVYDTNTHEWTVSPDTLNALPGTNIVAATYDTNTLQWTLPVTDLSRHLPGTNIQDRTYNTNTLTWEAPAGEEAHATFSAYFTNTITSGSAAVPVVMTEPLAWLRGDMTNNFNPSSGIFTVSNAGNYLVTGMGVGVMTNIFDGFVVVLGHRTAADTNVVLRYMSGQRYTYTLPREFYLTTARVIPCKVGDQLWLELLQRQVLTATRRFRRAMFEITYLSATDAFTSPDTSYEPDPFGADE